MKDFSLIRLRNVSKSFGDKDILNEIRLDIKKGDMIGLVGESGAGKTTLLKLIIGFLEPDKGDISFGLQKKDSEKMGCFGFSTQEKSFYSRLTINENLVYFAALHDIPKSLLDENINNVLKCVGLDNEKDVIAKNLSQGMQKRLDIACSIIHDPNILIFDEPTADMDPVLKKQIWSLIKDLNKENNKTIIVSSHDPKELFAVCDRIFLISSRKIKEIKGMKKNISKIYEG
ncbi:ATP-binding cassette domain-containing protein [Candidatus Woesearchaeota archaeon]|nr:ATP-binding cassette domain-containing protein [Candidatus Woesearchaeota archaeon]